MPSKRKLLTREEIKARFEAENPQAYCRYHPIFAPEYSFAFSLLLDVITPFIPQEARILDLGAGTGYLSLQILSRFPHVHVTLMDFSPNMLSAVDDMLADYKGHYSVLCNDFLVTSLEPGSFHAVVSSFAIHHARGPGEYRTLYERIYHALKPGGVFACLDLVASVTPEWSEVMEKGWRSHLETCFDAAIIERTLRNYRVEDSPLSIPEHFACLSQAGFSIVDVLWKHHNFALHAAQT
ncbi:MAG: class I SAM-dependent methyltransferase [Candidatus Hodarchaeales archaeon]|jgi:tRNA (cmo5U34)-methyltransferase